MKKIKAINIKSKQCEDLINSGVAVLRNDLREADMDGFFDYYLLNDGRLLLRIAFEKRDGVIYDSLDEYIKMKGRFAKRQADINNHPVTNDASFSSNLRIKVQGFENMISEAGAMLKNAFSIQANRLDYSLESLKILSGAIKTKRDELDPVEFEEKYFILITAYCGEIIRRQIKGDWKIKVDDRGMVQSVLILEKGKPEYTYRPEAPLNKILTGEVNHHQLDLEVKAELHKYGFIKGNETHYGIKP